MTGSTSTMALRLAGDEQGPGVFFPLLFSGDFSGDFWQFLGLSLIFMGLLKHMQEENYGDRKVYMRPAFWSSPS